MEKAFSLVKVGAEQKMGFPSYFMMGEANYWWESVKAMEDTEFIAWKGFIELFI